MKDNLRWFTVSREDLIDVLLGEEAPRGPSTGTPFSHELRSGMLALGCDPEESRSTRAVLPALVVLPDKSATETLSWLRVYAEDAFPISQFSRVILLSDWEIFGNRHDAMHDGSFRPERWASVALGETLAQSDAEVDLQSMPLSRVASSLTLPVGRTAKIFGHGDPTRVCVDRLRTISGDTRFGHRTIGVEQLTPIWALCGARLQDHLDVNDAVDLVVDASSEHFRRSDPDTPWHGLEFLNRFIGLRSDSVEQRVVAFTELALAVTRLPAIQITEIGATVLAAGCFMVGRSTSHVFLLSRYQRVAPAAFAWFGVMAALAGPRSWDGAWLRALKGAERLLRPDFRWTDSPSADIGWGEFAWIAGTFDNSDRLAALPKMLPRTLGVEVVPGAMLQVRLGQGGSEEARAAPQASAKERQLSDALNQIVGLALRATGPDARLPPNEGAQQQLGLDYPRARPAAGKVSRAKKGKGEPEGH
jgi:hypothetical protein